MGILHSQILRIDTECLKALDFIKGYTTSQFTLNLEIDTSMTSGSSFENQI